MNKSNSKSILNLNNNTRINEDNCYINLRNIEYQKTSNYYLHNLNNHCPKKTRNLSINQPSLLFKDGYGLNKIYIDNDSKLRNENKLTNKRNINQLCERTFKNPPYMGRGLGNIVVETKLVPGEDTSQNRPCNNLAGITINRFIPQIKCIRENIQNIKHIIPEDNSLNWVRGGIPSRISIKKN